MAIDGEVMTDTEVRSERAKRGRATPRQPRELIDLPEDATGHDRNLLPVVQEGLRILDPKRETFAERTERYSQQRKKYAAMQAHMEMAAMVLASGGSFRLASTKAGVSVRQVKKYYTDPDFRTRIEEMRQTTFSKIKGRLYKELEKRTRPGTIEHIELLDLLRVFDRVAGPVGGKAGVNIGEINVANTQYDTIIASLLAPVGEGEGADFPVFDVDSVRLPGEDSPE